jgi:hypothetical protein
MTPTNRRVGPVRHAPGVRGGCSRELRDCPLTGERVKRPATSCSCSGLGSCRPGPGPLRWRGGERTGWVGGAGARARVLTQRAGIEPRSKDDQSAVHMLLPGPGGRKSGAGPRRPGAKLKLDATERGGGLDAGPRRPGAKLKLDATERGGGLDATERGGGTRRQARGPQAEIIGPRRPGGSAHAHKTGGPNRARGVAPTRVRGTTVHAQCEKVRTTRAAC